MSIVATLSTLMMGVSQMDGAARPDRARPDRTKMSECLADVKEVVAWEAKVTQSSAITLCQLRRQRVIQQKRFASALVRLHDRYQDQTNHGFAKHIPVAQQDAKEIVNSCIDFKTGFTYPHNIATLTVPEEIYASCYGIGIKLVETELSRGSR
jgi:23S rRNA pseudoU1915 N3-methylase RlmH